MSAERAGAPLTFEWRVCWHGGYSGTEGESEWEPYEGQSGDPDEIKFELNRSTGQPSPAADVFWGQTNVEYWVEVREVEPASAPPAEEERCAPPAPVPGSTEGLCASCGHAEVLHPLDGPLCVCASFLPTGSTEDRDWLADVREVLADAYKPEGVEAWLDAPWMGSLNPEHHSNRTIIEHGDGRSVLVVAERTVGRTLAEIRSAGSTEEPKHG